MRIIFILFLFLLAGCLNPEKTDRPKLIVGIVVDQMKFDYLDEFEDNFGPGGFKRLRNEGYELRNLHYNYLPTETAPGHASIFTGYTPSGHGIIGNNWYDRAKKKMIYCLEDEEAKKVTGLGITESPSINELVKTRTPKRLLKPSISDHLKAKQLVSKVISLSWKDRGAIIPGGKGANYAAWFDVELGEFVSSSYYLDELPDWLVQFNKSKLPDSLLNLVWNPLLDDLNSYQNYDLDTLGIEMILQGKDSAIFPYHLTELRKKNGEYKLLGKTPYGNSMLTDLALTAIKKENLGKGLNKTDFITISYSSTDIVGHDFGTNSMEIEDTYLRLDRDIERLLNYLDQEVGENNYLLFLTADHGANHNPKYLSSLGEEAGFYNPELVGQFLENALDDIYGKRKYIEKVDRFRIYFDENIEITSEMKNTIKNLSADINGINEVVFFDDQDSLINPIVMAGHFVKRSGEAFLIVEENWIENRSYGTTHGNIAKSCLHVPGLWFGWKIPNGFSYEYFPITSIAPSVLKLMDLEVNENFDEPKVVSFDKSYNNSF